jgi:hypothetical protein
MATKNEQKVELYVSIGEENQDVVTCQQIVIGNERMESWQAKGAKAIDFPIRRGERESEKRKKNFSDFIEQKAQILVVTRLDGD